jgi:ribosome-associated toxin RatA of RatAB toxin-antitoxin module
MKNAKESYYIACKAIRTEFHYTVTFAIEQEEIAQSLLEIGFDYLAAYVEFMPANIYNAAFNKVCGKKIL